MRPGDGEARVFSSAAETRIPALRAYIALSAAAHHARAAAGAPPRRRVGAVLLRCLRAAAPSAAAPSAAAPSAASAAGSSPSAVEPAVAQPGLRSSPNTNSLLPHATVDRVGPDLCSGRTWTGDFFFFQLADPQLGLASAIYDPISKQKAFDVSRDDWSKELELLERAVALAGESVSESEKRAGGVANQLGKGLDGFNRNAGDFTSPGRCS